MATITIEVDGLPVSPNQLQYKHWTVKAGEKRKWQEMIGWLALANKPKAPFKKAIITFRIYVGDNRRHDPDNLAWSVTKPSLDALSGIIIEDDTIDNVELKYEFHRDKPRRFSIQIDEIA